MYSDEKLDAPATVAVVFLKLPEVRKRTGLSKSEIYRRAAVGAFPRRIKLGERSSVWLAQEIDQWASERISSRDGGTQ